MGQHDVEVLSHVVFSVDGTIKDKMGCAYTILKVYVLDLFVKSRPELTHMPTYEHPAAQTGSTNQWCLSWQVHQFALPGPGSIDGILFALPKLLLLLYLNLATNFSDSLEGSAAYNIVGVEQTREDVGHDAAVVVILIIEIASPNFYVFQELLPDLSVLVVDESGKVVDVVRWLVEILYGH